MKTIYLAFILCLLVGQQSIAQTYLDTTINSATKNILLGNSKFGIGSYGEAHYNAPIEQGKFKNGTADLHRVILFMGYKFNSHLQFFTEIEFEHVKEVYVEQAYIDYSFNSAFNLKAGVILIPMGYVNEFHEPTLFNGVERSSVDTYVIPSTWSEVGAGFHGLVKRANLKYQLYVVNGFKGYNNGSAFISGGSGLRKARQKGSEATFRSPALTGKISFYGLNGLRLGVSGYYGTTESSLYDDVDREDVVAVAMADSSRIGVAMAAVNLQYTLGKFQFTAIGNYTSLSNTEQYNTFTSSSVGSQIIGYYGEFAYKFNLKKDGYPKLVPFIRYEHYDTHFAVSGNTSKNEAYSREVLTGGIGLQITPGTVIKTDYQWFKSLLNPRPTNMFNLGFGYWF